MEKVCSEMAHCAMQTQPESIHVLWADTEIKGEQVFDPNDFAYSKLKPIGGGGTDMRVPLKHVEKLDPQVVVLMTDGFTPWPDRDPPFPLIVICTTDTRCPVGEVIRI
jgi:predicted metal-dependent peptidase